MKQATEAGSSLPVTESTQPSGLLHDVIVQTPQRPARADGIAVGTFDGIGADGSALVSIATFGLSRIRARSISPLDPSNIGQGLALGFEGGDPMQPIILGLMLAAPAAPAPAPAEVLLDGERVVLTAEHEIELRCGEAALILSADGRIQLRGTYITSHASATQRILGGSVNIN
ncbi:hypothetical protein INH39_01860 [Massilia violaceinigra]|uniref:DUF6484 domain-containing protein n=1 Tax=Massilia violaceinigra TaxID=2045208 RepID=A0ABY4A6X7_9BURK|nr:DUF6484 domain-containing protein [Massilia violaceinigra]UOD30520.1 hypothetical protein INH39_01860 [Massilia violaceinigra]